MAQRMMTDIGLRALKPRAKPYERPIGGGLRVTVQPSGHKSFIVRYRYGGRTRKLTLHPGLSLAAARREAADAFYQLERGIDPAIAKQQARQAQQRAATDTLAAVCDEYLHREGGKLRQPIRRRRTLDRLVLPTLGDRPIREIRRSELVRLFDKIEEERGEAAADNALKFLRRIFNWHAVRDDAFMSPIVRGMARRKPQDHARSRILSDIELAAVWKTAEADDTPLGALIRFLLLTAARRVEATHLTWAEIDGAGANWTLPGARNKTKLDLVRPLSKAAQGVLASLPRTNGFVFSRDGRQPIGGMSRRKTAFDKACNVHNWVLHDLRRSARSLLSRAGVNADHAERCLGHVIGGVRGVYDRHEFHREKQQAFEALAAQIDRIVSPRADNVTELKRKRRG